MHRVGTAEECVAHLTLTSSGAQCHYPHGVYQPSGSPSAWALHAGVTAHRWNSQRTFGFPPQLIPIAGDVIHQRKIDASLLEASLDGGYTSTLLRDTDSRIMCVAVGGSSPLQSVTESYVSGGESSVTRHDWDARAASRLFQRKVVTWLSTYFANARDGVRHVGLSTIEAAIPALLFFPTAQRESVLDHAIEAHSGGTMRLFSKAVVLVGDVRVWIGTPLSGAEERTVSALLFYLENAALYLCDSEVVDHLRHILSRFQLGDCVRCGSSLQALVACLQLLAPFTTVTGVRAKALKSCVMQHLSTICSPEHRSVREMVLKSSNRTGAEDLDKMRQALLCRPRFFSRPASRRHAAEREDDAGAFFEDSEMLVAAVDRRAYSIDTQTLDVAQVAETALAGLSQAAVDKDLCAFLRRLGVVIDLPYLIQEEETSGRITIPFSLDNVGSASQDTDASDLRALEAVRAVSRRRRRGFNDDDDGTSV